MTASPTEETNENTKWDASSDSNTFSLEKLLESIVRVTLAGFGASLVGLAKERQQFPSGQPRKPQHNLPLTWAFSAMIFVSVLESCRVMSPTTLLLRQLESSSRQKFDEYSKAVVVAVGDYSLGGSVAGLSGGLAAQRRTSASLRPPSIAWGLRTGLVLGCVAGVLQAGIDVAILYLLKQQEASRQEPSNTKGDR